MKNLFIISCILLTTTVYSQSRSKLNLGLDCSIGPHYYKSNIGNPAVWTVNLSYEYKFNKYFGAEAGIKGGGFYQNLKEGEEDFERYHDIYRGTLFAPFFYPKFYIDITRSDKYERPGSLFIGTKILYSFSRISTNNMSDHSGPTTNSHFTYEIKAGYEYPIHSSWSISYWIGYNSFDFSKINPPAIKFKNSTPIQIGIGFHYLLCPKSGKRVTH